jgi:hypothetical protein
LSFYAALHKNVETRSLLGQTGAMSSNRIVLEAIARRRCLHATYNRAAVRLAPHILYTRHDELFVDAVTLEHDGRKPRETRLGTFKLAGLREPAVAGQAFRLEPGFDPSDAKYAGVTLLAAEMD